MMLGILWGDDGGDAEWRGGCQGVMLDRVGDDGGDAGWRGGCPGGCWIGWSAHRGDGGDGLVDRGGDDGSGGGCKRVILGMARGMKGMMLGMVGGMFGPLAGNPLLYRGRINNIYM